MVSQTPGKASLQHLLLFVIVSSCLLAYTNSLTGSFLFDDTATIVHNPEVYRTWPAIKSRFLVTATFRLNYMLGGLNPADYHAVNLLIHIAAGLFLYGIIRQTLLLPSMREKYAETGVWIAAFSSCLWMVHPLQTESVTYICQRYESLMGMFYLLTLYCVIRGSAEASPLRSTANGQRSMERPPLTINHQLSTIRTSFWHIAAVVSCVLGMSCKEVMITCPVIVLLYDRTFLAGSFRKAIRESWGLYTGLAGTWCLLAALMILTKITNAESILYIWKSTPPLAYILTQCRVLMRYIALSFRPESLCLDYGWQETAGITEVWPHVLLIMGLFITTLWMLWRRYKAGFLLAWFFVILAPTSSFVPRPDAAFEHRMYLPLAAVVVLVVAALNHLFVWGFESRGWYRSWLTVIRVIVAAGIVLYFAMLTVRRNRDYLSEETMWRRAVADRPENLRARVSLAASLLSKGHHDEAEKELQYILDHLPEISDSTPAWIVNTYVQTQCNMGVLRSRMNEYELAETSFRKAIRASSGRDLTSRKNLGIVLREQGRIEEAIVEWRAIIELDPKHAQTYYCLGSALTKQRQYVDAISYMESAIRHDPSMIDAKIALAWLLATCEDNNLRNGDRAQVLATSVGRTLGINSVRVLDVLAASNAAKGDFDEAVRYAEKALILGKNRGMTGLEPVEERLNLFRKGQVFIERRTGFRAVESFVR